MARQARARRAPQLVRRLEPAALKEAVVEHQRFQDQKSSTNVAALFKLVEEKALLEDQLFQHSRSERKRPFTKADPESKREARAQPKPQGQSSDAQNAKPSNERAATDRGGSKRTCLHCKGDYFVRNCPTASKDEKDKLLAQLRETSKKPKPAGDAKAKRVVNCSGAGRVDPSASVCPNDKYSIPYCADSGSDWNIVSAQHVQELQQQPDSEAETARAASGEQNGGR